MHSVTLLIHGEMVKGHGKGISRETPGYEKAVHPEPELVSGSLTGMQTTLECHFLQCHGGEDGILTVRIEYCGTAGKGNAVDCYRREHRHRGVLRLGH